MNFLLNYIFPKQCVLCQKLDNMHLCSECLTKINSRTILSISKKAKNNHLFFSSSTYLQGIKYFSHPELKAVLSLFPYKNPQIKSAIHQFKYKNIQSLHYPLSRLMLQTLVKYINSKQEFIICPVPLHPKRMTYRGYNQSWLLANDLANDLNCQIFSGLKRIKYTTPQMSMEHIEQRKNNIKNAFFTNKHSVDTSLPIVLIDDVTTTLSTLEECSIALSKAGFSDIYAVTLAR